MKSESGPKPPLIRIVGRLPEGWRAHKRADARRQIRRYALGGLLGVANEPFASTHRILWPSRLRGSHGRRRDGWKNHQSPGTAAPTSAVGHRGALYASRRAGLLPRLRLRNVDHGGECSTRMDGLWLGRGPWLGSQRQRVDPPRKDGCSAHTSPSWGASRGLMRSARS